MSPSFLTVRREGAIARVFLARPEKRNAFDDHVAAEIEAVFRDLAAEDGLRVVVLGGEGETFCAGGDLAWMRRVAEMDREANLDDARRFQRAFEAIDSLPLPVVGRIQGAALGGGAGLVAVCDVVVAARGLRIGFPEVRLGLVPGVVSPYVLRRLGPGPTRRLFLTGEILDAEEAWRLGLVHRIVPPEELDAAVSDVVDHLLAASPDGLRRAKALVAALVEAPTPAAQAKIARAAIAEARASDEGREGTRAFLERRRPPWRT
ncbi:MAG: enoyl-CoA hydratase-related protein [Planctomycetota bacterium]